MTITLPVAITASEDANGHSQIYVTYATLHGYCNDDGDDPDNLEFRYQWGLTTSYTDSSSWFAVDDGVDDYPVTITGLTANTTYHYRAQAKNTAGTHSGEDMSFTTLAHPFFSKVSSLPIVRPNLITVRNEAYTMAGGASDASYAYQVHFREYIYPATDNTQAGLIADAIMQNVQLANQGCDVKIPILNLGQELWDYINIVDSREGGTSYAGNVQYIEETFDSSGYDSTWKSYQPELKMVIKFGGAGNLPSGNAIAQGRKIIDRLAQSDASQASTVGDLMALGDSLYSLIDEMKTTVDDLSSKAQTTYDETPADTSGS